MFALAPRARAPWDPQRHPPAVEPVLQALRLRLRHTLHLAMTLGYGPRVLPSTGQFHQGGPNIGLSLRFQTRSGLGRPGGLAPPRAAGGARRSGAGIRQGLAALREVVEAAMAEGK
jgi:hypothetical protein